MAETVLIPPAVVSELAEGRRRGIDLPVVERLEWITVKTPTSTPALPLVTDLGPGETEVLALALESPESIVIIDDAFARNVAEILGINLKGTLGLLLDAKRRGLVNAVLPLLDKLEELRFRISSETRTAVIRLAGEDV